MATTRIKIFRGILSVFRCSMITHLKLTINFFSVRRKMKSLSILLVFFVTTLAIRISEYHPNDATVSIAEGETLKLSCKRDLVGWDECEFSHESNGKYCHTYWIEENAKIRCKNELAGLGKMYQREGFCIIEVKDMKKEDAGNWTCKMFDNNQNSATHIFNVEVRDKQTKITKPINSSTATRPTEFMTFSILAFTFLIVF